jgi:hypothetical protein
MTRTVVVGMLLAFLLFTPQGHQVALLAIGLGVEAITRDPAADAARHAAEQADARRKSARLDAAKEYWRLNCSNPDNDDDLLPKCREASELLK